MKTFLAASMSVYIALGCIVGRGEATLPCEAREKLAAQALKACLEVTQVQDQAISRLKDQRNQLVDELAKAQKQPILPLWAVIGISALTGLAVGGILIHR